MAILQLLPKLLATKVTAVFAALALVGGGAAIAAEGAAEESVDEKTELADTDAENDWALGRADDEQTERIGAFCEENPEASFCSGDSHPVFSAPSDPPEEEEKETVEEETIAEETVEEEAQASEEENADEAVAEVEAEDTRSDTARRVHEALTGSEDIVPGDPEFGKTVSERARSGKPGDLGSLVSRAAQGEDLDAEDLELDERERKTSTEETDEAEEADEEARSNDQSDEDEDEAEASERPKQTGPPADTPAGKKGKGPGGR